MPTSAETSLSFVSLADLLDGIEPEALGGLPAPQRRGLEVALLRADPADEPAAPCARGLRPAEPAAPAGRQPATAGAAVDDLQWLDQSTAEMLAFAVRRLHGPSVRFLFAARGGSSSPVERALAQAGPQILEVGPLSVGGDARRMLVGQTGPGIAALRTAPGIRNDLGLPALRAGSRADTGRARSACARAGPSGARHGGGVAREARVAAGVPGPQASAGLGARRRPRLAPADDPGWSRRGGGCTRRRGSGGRRWPGPRGTPTPCRPRPGRIPVPPNAGRATWSWRG